jgi:hypothetical protein
MNNSHIFVAVLSTGSAGLQVLGASTDRGLVERTAAELLDREARGIGDPVGGPIQKARSAALRKLVEVA